MQTSFFGQSWARCTQHEPLMLLAFGQTLHTFSSEALHYALNLDLGQTFFDVFF
jgi:hypothetical protein